MAFLRTIGALLAGIIEKGRLQAEIEARLEQLTALDAARAELLSVVTHELRTPLSVVRVYVDLLGDAAKGIAPAPNPEAATEWQAAALDQVSRLDRLVDSILASVRGEGLTGLSRAPFDAVQAVGETVETLRLLLRPHPIRWERPDERLVAVGDETRFRQVLEQLLENESKYAPADEGVSIGVWRLGDEIQVYVTDDGPGVPIEDWESVFEPFVRIEGRGRSRGSGIGLFAARRLMDAMGGRIYLEPNGFGGSRFVVALPAGAGLTQCGACASPCRRRAGHDRGLAVPERCRAGATGSTVTASQPAARTRMVPPGPGLHGHCTACDHGRSRRPVRSLPRRTGLPLSAASTAPASSIQSHLVGNLAVGGQVEAHRLVGGVDPDSEDDVDDLDDAKVATTA